MSGPSGSQAPPLNKDDYEFLCSCESCRNLSWRDVQDGDVEPSWPDNLPEDQRKVPGDNARYLSYRTARQHLEDATRRRIKQGNRNVDPYETMWKELATGGRFHVQTFGATSFAKPGRVVLRRDKRARGENGDGSDDEEGDWVEGEGDNGLGEGGGGGESEGEDTNIVIADQNEYVEEAEPELFPANDDGPDTATGRDDALDSVSSLEALMDLHGPLRRLHTIDPHQAQRIVLGVECMLERGVPMDVINEVTRIHSSTLDTPGFTLDSFLKKFKMPYKSMWSCKEGHDLHEEEGSLCTKCSGQRCVHSQVCEVDHALRHLMRQPEMADNIMYGPQLQEEYLARLMTDRDKGAVVSRTEDNNEVGIDVADRAHRSLNIEATIGPDRRADGEFGLGTWGASMSSVWQSPAVQALKEKVGWRANDSSRAPVLCQLFVDAYQPFKGGYSMLLVTLKVLNPPIGVANDNLTPLAIIDGKQKPGRIDAVLEMIVDQFKAYAPDPGSGDVPKRLICQMGVGDAKANLCPYLLQVCVDSRAMRQCSHHREHPSKEVCNKCTMQGIMQAHPTKRHAQRIYPSIDPNTRSLKKRKRWAKRDSTARIHMTRAEKIADESSELVQYLETYFDRTPFAGLWYFDVVWGFPVCAMHQVMNVTKRALCHVLGQWCVKPVGWELEALKAFFSSKDVGELGISGLDWMLQSGIPPALYEKEVEVPPSWMKPPPREGTKAMGPHARNIKQGMRVATSAVHPTNYHGMSRHVASLATRGKGDEYFRKIKAAEGKDLACSGILPLIMEFGGVHKAVVTAYADLCFAIKQLCSHVVDWGEIYDLYAGGMEEILTRLQLVLPPTEMTSALHALIHLPEQVLRFGPLPDTWSFPFEGLFSKLKPMANLNKAVPAQTVATRSGLMMAVRDLTRGIRANTHDPRHDIVLSSPVEMSKKDVNSLRHSLLPLLLGKPLPADVLNQIRVQSFNVVEYKKLHIHKAVEVQGRYSRRTTRDNSHLLLRSGESKIPSLGKVQRLLRVSIPGISPELDKSTHRVYALVSDHPLWGGPENHPDVYTFADTVGCDRLVSLDDIIDQCFLGGDPNYPVRNDKDEFVADPTGYERHFVYTKGRLRNVSIDHDANFHCPDL